MSTERLRAAAKSMRERAEGAVMASGDGRWSGDGLDWDTRADSMVYVLRCDGYTFGQADTEEQAEHIASWHPAVALAVADLLDNEAALIDGVERHPDLHMPLNTGRCDLLLAVARAYLGEASS